MDSILKKYLFVLIITLIPFVAHADDYGMCGSYLNWYYKEATHTLTFDGKGAMYDYDLLLYKAPWNKYIVENIVFDKDMTHIGDYAFAYCEMESVKMPVGIVSIGAGSFSRCNNLSTVIFPRGLTSIDDYAFYRCGSLSQISIPGSIETIGEHAFDECSALTRVKVEAAVPPGVCNNSFPFYQITLDVPYDSQPVYRTTDYWKDSKQIVSDYPSPAIYISDPEVRAICVTNWDTNYDGQLSEAEAANVTDLEFFFKGSSIQYFRELAYFTGLTSIGANEFQGCSQLYYIVIPENVTSIKEYAFEGCTNMITIVLNQNVKTIGDYAFSNCRMLSSVNSCDNVEMIGNFAFKGCWQIKDIPSTKHLQGIGAEAFTGTGINELHLPKHNIVFQYRAFYGCNLTKVFAEATAPYTTAGNPFDDDISTNTILYVPMGCREAYLSAQYWNRFKEVFDEAPESPDMIFNDSRILTICLQNWDRNNDGRFTEAEAAMVTDLGKAFSQTEIYSFDELSYFTGLQTIADSAFMACSNLVRISIPKNVHTIGYKAFSGCNSLLKIIVDEQNPYLDSRNNCNAIIETATNTLIRGANWTIIPDGIVTIAENAFAGCYSMQSIDIPNSVTTIGAGAFSGCGLTSITIPNGVTVINNSMFHGCIDLVSVTIPENITAIGSYAFAYCKSLSSIGIPNGVTSIGDDAFCKCEALKSLYIPASVITIGKRAFQDCTGLTSIGISQSVTEISDELFEGCIGLRSVYIPKGVTKIGIRAFYDCTNLAKVDIPEGVTEIGARAFQYCRSLTSVILPLSVIRIRTAAFYYCDNLTQITIPRNVRYIEEEAFALCYNLTSVKVEAKEPPSVKENSFYGHLNLPLYVPVGSVSLYKASEYWKDFKEIIGFNLSILFVDARVEEICVDYWDTNGDGKLDEVEAAAVTNLGTAFSGNESITSFDELRYFTKLKSIGDNAFQGCSALSHIVIPENVTAIGKNAFNSCTALNSLSIPNAVEIINEGAFENCVNLVTLSLSDYLESIGISLELIKLPEQLETIGEAAFKNCSSLTISSLPSELTSIGSYAFSGCTGLTSMDIPRGITSMGNYVFEDCNSLTSVYVYCATMGNHVFEGCNSLTSVYVNCATIGNCFSGLVSIQELTLGNQVTTIGDAAFKGCTGLTSIAIPFSVFSIGDEAFSGCSNLTAVSVLWTSPVAITADVFTNRYNAILTVPCGCTDIYKSADYWKDFKGYEESNICFADARVKSLCVSKWDTNKDGELSAEEARAVESLGNTFRSEPSIKSFDELQFFTGLTSIDVEAFYGCSNLEHVILPNSVTSIYACAFETSGIKEIVIPNSVSDISAKAFYSCSKLESITLSNNLEIIEDQLFCNCNKLKNIVIPQSVKVIHREAFRNCSSLVSVVLSDMIEEIWYGAFGFCRSLTSIDLPASLRYIGTYAFAGCNALTSLKVDEGNTIFDSRANCNAIIETATNKLVSGCCATVIPNTVKTIGYGAFGNFSTMTEMNIPQSVTSIEAWAFCETGLTSVTIPVGVTSIADYAFAGCDELTSVHVKNPCPVELASNYVFSNSANATLYVLIGRTLVYQLADYWKDFKEIVEEVGDNITFADAKVKAICVANWDTNGDGELSESEAAAVTDLDNVFQFDEEITSFDEFRYFVGITSVGMLSDGGHGFDMPFSGCTSLASITLPPTMTRIGRFAFYECTSLSSITIPKVVTWVDSDAFGNMALKTVVVEDGNAVYDSRDNCNAIIKTETNTLKIGFATTVIPNTVTAIGAEAFYYSDIEDVTIPQSVVSIGDKAFGSWKTPIQSVTVEWQTPIAINQSAFYGNYNATLYVPTGCKAAYEAAQYWQDFKEIKEIGATELIPLTVGVEDVTVRLGSFIEDRPVFSFDFENDETMWGWGNDQEMGIAEGSYNGTKYQTTTNPRQAEFWENEIAMGFDQLVPGEVYVLEFWAKADKSFWLNANLQYPSEEAGWPSRGDFDWVEIGTEWQKFTMTTTVTGPDATQLVINIGELAGGTFCLDDISLRRKNPLFKLTYDGFVDGDDETTAFTTLPVASTTATNDSPVGSYPITVSGGVSGKYSITYQSGTLTIVSAVKGDANGDGSVTITDAVAVVNYILGSPSSNFNIMNANVNGDVDDDGNPNISITDAVGIVNIILNSSGSSSAPAMDELGDDEAVEPE
jgi:hypothetical protein